MTGTEGVAMLTATFTNDARKTGSPSTEKTGKDRDALVKWVVDTTIAEGLQFANDTIDHGDLMTPNGEIVGRWSIT